MDRTEKIMSLCKEKSVLHLGCADYPFSERQYKCGNLLHKKIAGVAKYILGLDNSAKGIAFLASLGYKNLLIGNVEKLGDLDINQQFDVVVAGELLEHLLNLGMFFSGVKSLMTNDGILILTVPNAHAVKGFLRVLLFKKELVHPDHVCYFSQATIGHLCEKYGLKITETFYYLTDSRNICKRLTFLFPRLFIKYISPCVGDGLILVAKRTIVHNVG